jgi:8-oxo-dGTP pyrophosphatase MutT (NUDIX family)
MKKILILKRSEKEELYQNRWGPVTGFIERNEKPLERVVKEIEEETGISKENLRLIKEYPKMEIVDDSRRKWVVFPFIFETKTRDVRLNQENTIYEWVSPEEIYKYDTIPAFKEYLKLLK